MMYAIVFSWSGSFRDRFEERREEIERFIRDVNERGEEVGVVTSGEVEEVAERLETDFVIPHVGDLKEVLASLTAKYDKVFFVTDVRAELVTANQSGAFTFGFSSEEHDADQLSGVGPNYLVDSFEEIEKIIEMEDAA